jgi:surfactin synthase thioesterase subunit
MSGARPLLACLPHGGGVAAVYASWWAELRGQVDVRPVEYPGHGTRPRERLARSLGELVAQILADLEARGRRPLAVFGHSFGAIVGFELARAAQSAGWEVAALIASGCVPPQVGTPPRARADGLRDQAADCAVAAMEELGGLPSILLGDAAYTARTSPLVAAASALLDAYRYRAVPLLEAPVHALGGDRDPVVDVAALARWPELSVAGGKVRVLPGGHFYHLHRRPEVIAAIGGWLAAGSSSRTRQGPQA